MRIPTIARNRIAVALAALTIVAVSGVVHAQFSPPTCVPPSCNPTVIQNIDVVTGSAQTASINVTGSAKLGGTFQTGATPPTLTLASENLIYGNVAGTSTNASLLLLQYGGADRLRISLAGQQTLPLGTLALPSYSFVGDTNTGLYSSAADSMSLVTNGVARLTINNSGTTLASGVLSAPTGSAAAPSYTFTGDTNTGIYRSAADTINIATNGVSRFQIDSTGAVTIPGSLTVNGVFTASGGLGGDGSAITNINASNITSGTLSDARLSTNVALLNGNQTFTGANTFTNAANSFTGSGAGLTSLNASNVTSGTLADARLSSNVALLNRASQTFTGNNTFTGMTSFGSAVLVAGAGQNVLYGVADVTSTGNLLLLQTESAGVYTDRFRVSATGAVTAASFAGSGAGLTSLNASNLASGTVPSARISGTYSNNLTFSGQTTFGSAATVVAGGQNLIYGNVDTTSAGNLLLLQNESVDRFRVDAAGNLITAGSITAGGSALCQQNGANCPPMMGGSGTTNYLPKFAAATTLGDSQVQDNGVGVGVGGAPTADKLRVYGTINATDNIKSAYGLSADDGAAYFQATPAEIRLNSPNAFNRFLVDSNGRMWVNGLSTLTGGATIGSTAYLTLTPTTLASLPVGSNGAMYYDSGTNKFRCFSSGVWADCGAGNVNGTTNYLSKFTSATTVGNSTIQDNGTNIGIGGAPSGWSVEVYGNIHGKGFNGSVLDQTAIYGQQTSNSAFAQAGVYGVANGTQYGYGVYGIYNGTNGSGYGVFGRADGAGHTAIYGYSNSGRAGYFYTNGGPAAIRAQAGASPFLAIDADGDIYGNRHLTIGGNATLGDSAGDVHVVNGNLSFGANSRFTLPSINSDPGSPVNGMMYYNTAGVFRCYENSVWKNCIQSSAPTLDTVLAAGNSTTRTMTTGAQTINAVGAVGLTVNGAFGQNGIQTSGGYAGIDSSGTAYGGKFTSAGAYGIHVSNTGTGAGLRYGAYVDTSAALNAEGVAIIGNNSNLALDVTNGNVYFSGRLGIGNNAPTYPLDVTGQGRVTGELGVNGQAPTAGWGITTTGSSYAGVFYGGSYGVYASGSSYALYGAGNAYVSGEVGIGTGSTSDIQMTVYNDSTAYAYLGRKDGGINGKGIMAYGDYYGGYFNDTNGTAYLYAAFGGYGAYGLGSTSGGYFANTAGGATTYLGYSGAGYGVYVSPGDTYGIVAYGNSTGARFYDADGTATTFLAGASWGVEIITGGAVKPGGGSWSAPSDRRTKRDISDFGDGLSVVRALNPVNYTYNGLGETPEGMKGIGFIAQEVEKVAPYMIQHEQKKLHPEDAQTTDIMLVDPSSLPFIELNAIKELDLRVDGLEAKIGERLDANEAKVKELEARVQDLEKRIDALQR